MQYAAVLPEPRRLRVAATYSELQRRILHWEETGREGTGTKTAQGVPAELQERGRGSPHRLPTTVPQRERPQLMSSAAGLSERRE